MIPLVACQEWIDRGKKGNRKTGYKSPAIVHAREAVAGSRVLLGKVIEEESGSRHKLEEPVYFLTHLMCKRTAGSSA